MNYNHFATPNEVARPYLYKEDLEADPGARRDAIHAQWMHDR